MQETNSSTTEFLVSLGSVDQIKTQAQQNGTLKTPAVFNSHIHLPPNFSAFDTIAQAVDLASQQGVNILGAGNYYDFSIYETFVQLAQEKGIFPLLGTEIIALETGLQKEGIRINDPGNPGKYYICGKSISRFQPFTPRGTEINASIRKTDAMRMQDMAGKLNRMFASHNIETNLDDQAIIARVVKRHGCKTEQVVLQERHLCQAFQEVFFEVVSANQRVGKLKEIFGTDPKSDADDAVGIQNEIRSHLMKTGKPCYVPETFGNLAQAKELIDQLGGIACYPVLADGSKDRCEYETPVETLIENLKANNYSMVELIPIRNQPDALAEYVTAIRKAGIAAVAGTEHNTLSMLPIEPTCVKDQPIPAEIKEIFTEGICILAAHQFLCAHDQPGYAESYNNAEDKEEIISTFAKIGATVLKLYFEKYPQ